MTLAPITNLDYVILLCDRLAETRNFYRDVMRFALETDRPAWVSFRVGSTLLTLRPRGTGPGGNDGPGAAGSASVQLAFRVPPAAIDDWHAELIVRNVPIVGPPRELAAWRHRALFFRDPEGNSIELYAEI